MRQKRYVHSCNWRCADDTHTHIGRTNYSYDEIEGARRCWETWARESGVLELVSVDPATEADDRVPDFVWCEDSNTGGTGRRIKALDARQWWAYLVTVRITGDVCIVPEE